MGTPCSAANQAPTRPLALLCGRQRPSATSHTGSCFGQQWMWSSQHVASGIGQHAHWTHTCRNSCWQQHVVPGKHSVCWSHLTGSGVGPGGGGGGGAGPGGGAGAGGSGAAHTHTHTLRLGAAFLLTLTSRADRAGQDVDARQDVRCGPGSHSNAVTANQLLQFNLGQAQANSQRIDCTHALSTSTQWAAQAELALVSTSAARDMRCT